MMMMGFVHDLGGWELSWRIGGKRLWLVVGVVVGSWVLSGAFTATDHCVFCIRLWMLERLGYKRVTGKNTEMV